MNWGSINVQVDSENSNIFLETLVAILEMLEPLGLQKLRFCVGFFLTSLVLIKTFS